MSIQVNSLVKAYGSDVAGRRAVDGITFEALSGQVLGFLGPNGAGKTTTMKVLTGILPPTQGSATVAGFDIETQSIEARRAIGYLPEANPLYMDMYVQEHLAYSGGFYGLRGAPLKRRIAEVIEQTGLGPEQHKRVGQLSKGYKQRVGLAGALLHNPPVLILDEPTSGLDPNQLHDIRALLRQLAPGRTIVFSTHILQEVEALCDRVVIISQGKVVADDTLAGLRARTATASTLEVELDRPADATALAALKALPQVAAVRALSAGPNQQAHRYTITLKESKGNAANSDVRPALFAWAVAHGHAILGQQAQAPSLEALFRNLTQAAAPATTTATPAA